MNRIVNERPTSAWVEDLSERQRVAYDAMTRVRNSLMDILGLEGAIYMMDYLTTRDLHPSTADPVKCYVAEMQSACSLTLANVQNGLKAFADESDGTMQFASGLKYYLTNRVCHAVPVTVMNYGFDNGRREISNLLDNEAPFRFGLQLYEATVGDEIINDMDVLEVGSGNGGGANYLHRVGRSRSYRGVDICFDNVDFCESNFGSNSLSFRFGDAEQLPIANGSKDLVINIESFHIYPHPEAFFREVARVLKPTGRLVMSSIITPEISFTISNLATKAGLKIVQQSDITDDVERGLQNYLPVLLDLSSRLNVKPQQKLYERLISSRSFKNSNSNWRGQNLCYWRLAMERG